MEYQYAWPALLLVAFGCAQPAQIRDRSGYLAEASRAYPGEDKERLISAAEAILRQSDPNNIDVRYSPDGFTALRRYFIYAIIATQSGREKWDFSASNTAGGTRASLTITEAGVGSSAYSSAAYDRPMASVPLYRLFWGRVDYMLGRRPDWITCDQAQAELLSNSAPDTLSGLCGPTSAGRTAPPPERLPALVIQAPPKRAGKAS